MFLVGADKITGYILLCELKMGLSCPKAVLENKCIGTYYRYIYIAGRTMEKPRRELII